jgi:hypothetical protein
MSPPQLPTGFGADDQAGRKSGIFVFDSKLGPNSNSNRVSKRGRSDELHELRNRLRVLENSLGKSSHLTPETSVCDVLSEVDTANSSDNVGVDDRVRFLPDSSFRGKKVKTRYFGRSHYTTTVSFVSVLHYSDYETNVLIRCSSKISVPSCGVVVAVEKERTKSTLI